MRGFIYIILLLSIFSNFAQIQRSKDLDSVDLAFLKHLNKEKLWTDGNHFLKSFTPSNQTNYYKGFFHYNLEKIDSSIYYFNKVRSNSINWDQSVLLSAFQYAYRGDLDRSSNILEEYTSTDNLLNGVSNLQQSGVALLRRDVEGFMKLESSFGEFYQLAPYEDVLLKSKKNLESMKTKSPVVAGLLSAVFPGMGRFYIGKPGEGIATLLVSGVFALQAREAYKKDGVRSPRFIIFGSLLSISYVSNIWGSVFSVKVANLEKNSQINEDILLNMHIPLRVIFD